MSIELLLFCVVLILAVVCLLLAAVVMRNHTQIRELREQLSRLDARVAAAPASDFEADVDADIAPVGLRLIRPAQLEAEVRTLVGEGRLLEAVDQYRQRTGVSLREARDAVRDIVER